MTSNNDPAINKVGYYLTRKEMDQLDMLATELKPILRDKHGKKINKNLVVRALLTSGMNQWKENPSTSNLIYYLSKKL